MQGKLRDTYFDNLKAILIFLVVLGHFANLNKTNPLLGAISNVIYSFHMPLFIFISGYFSKNVTSQRLIEIETILYPYLVFQVLNYVFTKLTGLGFGTSNIFIPTYQNWYLLGMLFWRTLIPYFNFFNKKHSLLLSIFFSFLIGFFEDFSIFLGLYRILFFFPAFILGYFISDLSAILGKISKYKHYFIITSLVCLFLIFSMSFSNSELNNIIADMYTPYTNHHGSIFVFYLRIIGFLSSFIISFGLLFMIPKRKFKVTYIGEHSLNIFLLHMFVVFPISIFLFKLSGFLILLISIISSILICLMFSNKFAGRILLPFTNFKNFKLIFRSNLK